MEHTPSNEYRHLYKAYTDSKITKEEFLRRYREPPNTNQLVGYDIDAMVTPIGLGVTRMTETRCGCK